MITHEFDLDAPLRTLDDAAAGSTGAVDQLGRTAVSQNPSAARSSGGLRLGILALALALAGVATGSVLAAAPSNHAQPPPVSAGLVALDASLTADGPSVVLRLTLENLSARTATVTGLAIDGATPARLTRPLRITLATGARQVVDVPVSPRCSGPQAGQSTTPLQARVFTSGSGGVPAVVSNDVSGAGGLCDLLDRQLPRGWRTPLAPSSVKRDKLDLVIVVPGLKGQELAGGPPSDTGVVQASALANERVIPATLAHGTRLRLIGPAPCLDGQDGQTVPTGVRLLVHSPGGLQQVLVRVGPILADWLTTVCPVKQ